MTSTADAATTDLTRSENEAATSTGAGAATVGTSASGNVGITGERIPTFEEQSKAVLGEVVRALVGSDEAKPRPGQAALSADIAAAMQKTRDTGGQQGGRMQGQAGTGVGKSFAYLAPAMTAAAMFGERTVISTEMISLQTQIIDKDAPMIAAACERVTGVAPKTAVHKGWSNYSCTLAAYGTAVDILGVDMKRMDSEALKSVRDQMVKAAEKKRAEADKLAGTTTGAKIGGKGFTPGAGAAGGAAGGGGAGGQSDFSPADMAANEADRYALIAWALDQGASIVEARPNETGDKNHYSGNLQERHWGQVSVSSSDCVGAAKCKFSDVCLPGQARQAAADADILVTNHHLLGVQAANAVPVVIGNKKLGKIDHIVVDEAHGLPSTVRDKGSVEVSGQRMRMLMKALTGLLDEHDTKVDKLLRVGESLAQKLDAELRVWTDKISGRESVLRLADGDDPVNDTAIPVRSWCKAATAMLTEAAKFSGDQSVEIKAKRLKNRLGEFDAALDQIAEHQRGTARWVEVKEPHRKAGPDAKPYPVAQYTPVDVGGMLDYMLWSTPDEDAIENQVNENDVTDETDLRRELTVALLSATLPHGFAFQAGVSGQPREYASPFDDAYGASILFIPQASSQDDIIALGGIPGAQKAKFNVKSHEAWALRHMEDLIAANGGHALVLSAKAESGRWYAEQLRAHSGGRWNVLSQWDGPPTRLLVNEWKATPSTVLIGTKSLMTGVDAAGETCSLVIVDRPARSAGNPVDDARVEMLCADGQRDKWAADRMVYVADAGMLLEQSAGRLIRTISDSGMVAVLDPRLLKNNPFSYQEMTRREYMQTLHRFVNKTANAEDACRWLSERRARLEAKAS